MSGFVDYLSHLLYEEKIVESLKTDMSDFEEKVKQIISTRRISPLQYHDSMIEKMHKFSRTHFTQAGMIRAIAYALTVYADKTTWRPKMEDGFEEVHFNRRIFPKAIPSEVAARIRSKKHRN